MNMDVLEYATFIVLAKYSGTYYFFVPLSECTSRGILVELSLDSSGLDSITYYMLQNLENSQALSCIFPDLISSVLTIGGYSR